MRVSTGFYLLKLGYDEEGATFLASADRLVAAAED